MHGENHIKFLLQICQRLDNEQIAAKAALNELRVSTVC